MIDQVELTVVGAINVDLTARVARHPVPGETVGDGVLSRQAGGKGANQAAAAARLGARVRLVGAIGDGPTGAELKSSLKSAGVDTSGMQTVAEPTGTALIVVDEEGENTIVVCPGANAAIDTTRIVVDPGSAVLAQLEVADEVILAAATQTRGFFALNAAPARSLPAELISRVDLFIVNEGEYAQLPEIHNADLLAVSLGADGARLLRHGIEVARARAVKTDVRNTVGAGDAFSAALVLGLLRGDSDAVALQRACAVGAAAVADERSQPLLDELDSYPAA
ncbi:PfkB family carbohydrate kinase [Microbacterium sp. NPDC019599]|uniref:PfkB family carbohydrate kinase n=1 Tax=Microbacterium sp. NPDC019599 TaxID=3154690 RepID=UPI0033E5DAC9